jgi:hypothetical protein
MLFASASLHRTASHEGAHAYGEAGPKKKMRPGVWADGMGMEGGARGLMACGT